MVPHLLLIFDGNKFKAIETGKGRVTVPDQTGRCPPSEEIKSVHAIVSAPAHNQMNVIGHEVKCVDFHLEPELHQAYGSHAEYELFCPRKQFSFLPPVGGQLIIPLFPTAILLAAFPETIHAAKVKTIIRVLKG